MPPAAASRTTACRSTPTILRCAGWRATSAESTAHRRRRRAAAVRPFRRQRARPARPRRQCLGMDLDLLRAHPARRRRRADRRPRQLRRPRRRRPAPRLCHRLHPRRQGRRLRRRRAARQSRLPAGARAEQLAEPGAAMDRARRVLTGAMIRRSLGIALIATLRRCTAAFGCATERHSRLFRSLPHDPFPRRRHRPRRPRAAAGRDRSRRRAGQRLHLSRDQAGAAAVRRLHQGHRHQGQRDLGEFRASSSASRRRAPTARPTCC